MTNLKNELKSLLVSIEPCSYTKNFIEHLKPSKACSMKQTWDYNELRKGDLLIEEKIISHNIYLIKLHHIKKKIIPSWKHMKDIKTFNWIYKKAHISKYNVNVNKLKIKNHTCVCQGPTY